MQIDLIDLIVFLGGAVVGSIVGYRVGSHLGRAGTVARLVKSRDPGHWTAAHYLHHGEEDWITPGPLPIIPRKPDEDGSALIPTVDQRRPRVTARSAKTKVMRRSGGEDPFE